MKPYTYIHAFMHIYNTYNIYTWYHTYIYIYDIYIYIMCIYIYHVYIYICMSYIYIPNTVYMYINIYWIYIYIYTFIKRRVRCSALWPQRCPVDGRRRRAPGLGGGQDPVPTYRIGEVPDALQRALAKFGVQFGVRQVDVGQNGRPMWDHRWKCLV